MLLLSRTLLPGLGVSLRNGDTESALSAGNEMSKHGRQGHTHVHGVGVGGLRSAAWLHWGRWEQPLPPPPSPKGSAGNVSLAQAARSTLSPEPDPADSEPSVPPARKTTLERSNRGQTSQEGLPKVNKAIRLAPVTFTRNFINSLRKTTVLEMTGHFSVTDKNCHLAQWARGNAQV